MKDIIINGRMNRETVQYRMLIGKMLQAGIAVQIGDFIIISPANGMCAFFCLAHLAIQDPSDLGGFEDAFAAGKLLHKRDTDGDLTQSLESVIAIGHELGVGLVSLPEYIQAAATVKNMVKGKMLNGYPMDRMLINVSNQHCCLAITNDAY